MLKRGNVIIKTSWFNNNFCCCGQLLTVNMSNFSGSWVKCHSTGGVGCEKLCSGVKNVESFYKTMDIIKEDNFHKNRYRQ